MHLQFYVLRFNLMDRIAYILVEGGGDFKTYYSLHNEFYFISEDQDLVACLYVRFASHQGADVDHRIPGSC